MNLYTVLVDFESENSTPHFVETQLNVDYVEDIGPDQWQVGFGVWAPDETSAYQQAVGRVVLAHARDGIAIHYLSHTVYPAEA